MNSLIQWAIRLLSNISSAQWKAVLNFVLAAADKHLSGGDKKAWVIDNLEKLGIKGSTANFLVEAALKYLRRTKQVSE